MQNEPTDPHASTPSERFNRRLGLILFFIYLALYGAFVAIVAIDYRIMGRIVFSGLNLAIVYGMGLIVGAFLLALVYMGLARDNGPEA